MDFNFACMHINMYIGGVAKSFHMWVLTSASTSRILFSAKGMKKNITVLL